MCVKRIIRLSVCVCVQLERLRRQCDHQRDEVKVTTSASSHGRSSTAAKMKSRPGERSRDSLRLLKDMRSLQTSLRRDQLSWDFWYHNIRSRTDVSKTTIHPVYKQIWNLCDNSTHFRINLWMMRVYSPQAVEDEDDYFTGLHVIKCH